VCANAAGDRIREHVLDAAERLFAARGYFGTSVRDVTQSASVRLAAVNYHFGSKEELFRAVVARRAEELGAARRALLSSVPRRGPRAERARAIVQAFVAPTARRAVARPEWRAYLTLIAQVATARFAALSLLAPHFDPTALAFVQELGEVFPKASQSQLHHAYQHLLAVTLYAFSDNRRLDSLTGGALRSRDFAALEPDLVTFVTAGIVGTCAPRRRSAFGSRPSRP
jgi:AcrR family transcriptional regulator